MALALRFHVLPDAILRMDGELYEGLVSYINGQGLVSYINGQARGREVHG